MTTTTNTLLDGDEVLVNGQLGLVLEVRPNGFVTVRLLGELRADDWHPSQVRRA